ncbi:MAG: UDP-N-acetylmuramate--L-alanine ligase [Actinomycetota bacterium]
MRTLRSAHLVGIGGAGMSGIARLLLARGVVVSGSDLKEAAGLAALRAAGAQIRIGHRADYVGEPDAVVVSTAIPARNVEVRAAQARRIPILSRAQVLAALMQEHRGIAIAGTHGKTTTTSMLAVVLERAGADPTYVIGGDLNESGSNARSGAGEYFVAEADESDGSFLLLSPEIAVVTNVEEEHHDFYANREEVEDAFVEFCTRAELAVASGDDDGARRVLARSGVRAVTYGETDECDVRISGIDVARAGGRCRVDGLGKQLDLSIRLPGRHYLHNAVAAIIAAREAGVPPNEAARILEQFAGVHRRFEERGTARGAEFVDDYAHHPTEIAATLAAARSDGDRRVWAVFQPHRYSRTAALWRGLGESLAAADVVVVTDVYPAGEAPIPGVSGKLVVDALVELVPGRRVVYLPHRIDVARFLAGSVRAGDLVLTLGAGDITMVGEETIARLDATGR